MKNLLILFLIGSIYNTTIAQNFYFGLKGGLNLATLSGDTSGLDSRTAMHGGIISEFIITDEFSIQPELLYSAQGAKKNNQSLKLDYLILPIMGKYYVSEGFSLEIGPQFGVLLSAKQEIEGEEYKANDIYRGFDLTANFGLGYKLKNGLNFSLRYNLGLSNAYFTLDDFFYKEPKAHHSVIQISVGYFL